MAHGHRYQPNQRVYVCQSRLSDLQARWRRQDRQYRIHDVDFRRLVCACLRGQQRGHRATDALTRQRRASDNIQANAILPGWIDTDLTRSAREQVPGLHENVLRRTPAARWGVINDLSGIAVFLASAASDFITGAAIPVDGGYSVQG